MPANLPPQYREAEQRYRRAASIPEKLAALQEMLAIMPKHKGTDHLKADVRGRIARLMEELERPARSRGGRVDPFSLKKEGVGTAALIGLTNSGKSHLLMQLTHARPRVAAYPYTTREPMPGMLPFENVHIQVVDTPPITDPAVQTRLYGLLRNADVLVAVVDLSADALGQVRDVFGKLEEWGFALLARGQAPDPENPRIEKRVILAANKADMDGALDHFQSLMAVHGSRFPVILVSAVEGVGLEDLAQEMFQLLDVVRVYTKAPGEEPHYEKPLVLSKGLTVRDAAESLRKEWRHRLRYALLWGSGKFDGQRVSRDYILADGDVIELHE